MILSNSIFAGGGGHKHHVGIFTGFTYNPDLKHNDFSAAIDYEYRISTLFGAGIITDFVFAERTEYLFFGGVWLHPVGDLKFVIGNGVAMTEHEEVIEDQGETEKHKETLSHYAFLAGVGYDFHAGPISITPGTGVHLINGHVSYVYGVTLGIGF